MRLLHACPPSCKHLPVDLTDSEPARKRLRALELIDQMVTGQALRRRLPRCHAQRLAPGLNRQPGELAGFDHSDRACRRQGLQAVPRQEPEPRASTSRSAPAPLTSSTRPCSACP